MDFKILLLVLALGISCGCLCNASVVTSEIYADESGIDSVVLQQINLQQQPESEVDVVGELGKKNKKTCELCRKISKPVLKFLNNSTNQGKIRSTLQKICNVLPGSPKKKCNTKLKHFFPLFVLQLKGWTPRTFCIAAKLCDIIPKPSIDLSEDISDTWNDLDKEVSLKLNDPNDQWEIIELLMKGCDVLEEFEGLPEKCKTLVSTYGPSILDSAEHFFESYGVSSSGPDDAEN